MSTNQGTEALNKAVYDWLDWKQRICLKSTNLARKNFQQSIHKHKQSEMCAS